MFSVPNLQILDIAKLKRKSVSMKTENKNCIVISCRLSGESLFFYKNKTIVVKKGDLLYIPYGSSYQQETKKEELICIHLTSHSKLSNKIKISTPSDPDHMCRLFEQCYNEFVQKKPHYEYQCMSLLYEILSYINIEKDNREAFGNPSFNLACEYLENHIYDADFSIGVLCQETKISRTYFNQLFKNFYNTTPQNYINTTRIERAKFLLSSKDYTNKEVAILCGFNDEKYFYTVFKKVTGKTTTAFLKSVSQTPPIR